MTVNIGDIHFVFGDENKLLIDNISSFHKNNVIRLMSVRNDMTNQPCRLQIERGVRILWVFF